MIGAPDMAFPRINNISFWGAQMYPPLQLCYKTERVVDCQHETQQKKSKR